MRPASYRPWPDRAWPYHEQRSRDLRPRSSWRRASRDEPAVALKLAPQVRLCADPTDPNQLDSDRDGVASESSPAPSKLVRIELEHESQRASDPPDPGAPLHHAGRAVGAVRMGDIQASTFRTNATARMTKLHDRPVCGRHTWRDAGGARVPLQVRIHVGGCHMFRAWQSLGIRVLFALALVSLPVLPASARQTTGAEDELRRRPDGSDGR